MPNSEWEQKVRETAYFLWEQDGRPEGRQDEYWRRALEMAARERIYDRMLEAEPDDGEAEKPGKNEPGK